MANQPPPLPFRDPDEFLTRPEAAREIRVSDRTLGNWIKSGRLQAWRTPTGHYRIKRQWLLDAMNDAT